MAVDAEGTDGEAPSALAMATVAPGGLATAPDAVATHPVDTAGVEGTQPAVEGTQPGPAVACSPSML